MKADSIKSFKRYWAQSYGIRETVRQGNVSGIILAGDGLGVAAIDDDVFLKSTLTVKVNSSNPSRTDFLLNRVPLAVLADISQYHFGQSASYDNYNYTNGMAWEELLSAMSSCSDATLKNKVGSIRKYTRSIGSEYNNAEKGGIMIPLGFLHLGADRELEIKLDLPNNPASSATIWNEVSILTYTDVTSADHMLQYDLTSDLEKHVTMVNSAWLFREDLEKIAISDDDELWAHNTHIQMTIDDEVSREMSLLECLYMTNIVGRVENSTIKRTALLFEKQSDVPSRGFVEVDGFEDIYKMLIVREVYVNKEVSKNTVSELEKEAKKIEKIELESPETAEAMRHAGVISKSNDIQAVVLDAKEKGLDKVN